MKLDKEDINRYLGEDPQSLERSLLSSVKGLQQSLYYFFAGAIRIPLNGRR